MKIALIGDYSDAVTAHRAIPIAIALASQKLSIRMDVQWVQSMDILHTELDEFDGFWCVPASPYLNMESVLEPVQDLCAVARIG